MPALLHCGTRFIVYPERPFCRGAKDGRRAHLRLDYYELRYPNNSWPPGTTWCLLPCHLISRASSAANFVLGWGWNSGFDTEIHSSYDHWIIMTVKWFTFECWWNSISTLATRLWLWLAVASTLWSGDPGDSAEGLPPWRGIPGREQIHNCWSWALSRPFSSSGASKAWLEPCRK